MLRPTQLHAQQVDVIRGRVTGPDSLPIESARVTVTSISGNVTRNARTDKEGRFTVTFPNGDGDYMVNIAALGYGAKRFEVKRVADEDVLIADARLQRAAAQLAAMEVRAERDRVSRNDNTQPDIGGTERTINNANVPADALGDLAAMAASLPGVQLVPGENGDPNGFSVLGLGADQNNTTLNGMNFGGANLPRDAQVSTSVMTSPYDVSRGGFSGAQMSLRTRSGSNFVTRNSSLQLDAPQLQWTDPAARALGQQYSNVSLGGSASGPLVFDKAFYNVAWQAGRRANDYQSLLNTDPLGLQAAGVAADSVQRLLGILGTAGVPASIGGIASSRASDNGSVFGSIDVAPPGSTSGQAWNISFNGNWNRQKPASGFATELPSFSGERTNLRGGIQGRHSAYFTAFNIGVLTETSAGISGSRNDADPYLTLPAGRVRVSSIFDDSTSGVQMLSFGGNQGMSSTQRTLTSQVMNMLSWFSANNKHRVKLTSELRHESYTTDQTSNLLGTFSYNSLADLEANRPASYSRTLGQRERTTSQLVGGLSLGDAYRHSRDLQIQYGVRLDANRFTTAPAFNAEVERQFGARNDHLPNRVYVSPRVGFSWTYGQAAQIGAFEGAFRGPRAVVRGGFGVFQNTPGVQSVGQAIDNTGLPSAIQQLVCVGEATPIPDWERYLENVAAIPSRCADGSAGTVFASDAPNVTLFENAFQAPRSLRGNLQWSGPVLDNRFMVTVDATYSRNQHQQSLVDLNFAPTSRFSLADEGNRPVYTNASSIVPATGQVASRDSRVSNAFMRVNELRSDLASESRQLRLGLSPMRFSTKFSWNLSYVYSNVREQVRGFTGTTTGNPFDVEWTRSGFDSRHQIQYSLGYNFFDAVRVNWFGSFRSGNPYTPLVAGDVNGDGWANDRAFIFDPARASGDPSVASAIRTLLATGSKGARECLAAQLGSVAARNSCQGPWSQTANLSISFNPTKVRLPQRASLSLNVSNPLGAADMLLHGTNNLRGWGQMPSIDNALLYVRGFDPVARRYTYDVNERFGSTRVQNSAFRMPVALTAMLRFDVGPARERQLLTQQLDRGRRTRGTKAPEPMLRAMYAGGGILNPMATILRQQDSLQLSAVQADSIASMNRRYTIKLDSIWAPLTKEFANLPDNYDHDEIYERYRSARESSVDLLRSVAPTVKELLTPEQRRKLPAAVASHLEPRYLAQIRSGTSGFGGSGVFMGAGGAMVATEQVIVGGGGGGMQVIIRQ